MRLVDIDDIRVMKFLSEEDDPSESDGEREYRNGWNDALTAINDIQPSAEPVRCKDCRWAREACGGNIECFVDSNMPEYHGYEWFCPNGERRRG